ncbi:uncharacterized protein LOC133493633 isoform X6 [Syngnathoides biaculeatus]|uniref:uncharacterized protein LOC133493633 isoform X6 n=1 Tax=Syngnathoides biaculeatus TaxID=300417 RepID=UPI002ADD3F45|nr:uncharacterized protein LOC133493633 isoform X6 [Syngnathoides biaculeatus]XP_061663224.1 uncharacterized protein LOC133493633 isoform X6 [Syngnathoides biaculeatus]
MRAEIERQSAELAALTSQVRQGLANQPSNADVATATDSLLIQVVVETDPPPRQVHIVVGTDLPPRQVHVAVGTDSPPCQAHVAVETDPPPRHSHEVLAVPSRAHAAVGTDPLPRHAHVSVSTDSLPTLVHVALETDSPPRHAHIAVSTNALQVHVAVGTDLMLPPPSHVAVQEVAMVMGSPPSHVAVQEVAMAMVSAPCHVPVQEVAMVSPPSHVPVQEELVSSVEPPWSWRDFGMAVMVAVMALVLRSIILFAPEGAQPLPDLTSLVTNQRVPPDQASVATRPWSSRNHGVGGSRPEQLPASAWFLLRRLVPHRGRPPESLRGDPGAWRPGRPPDLSTRTPCVWWPGWPPDWGSGAVPLRGGTVMILPHELCGCLRGCADWGALMRPD